MDQRRCPACRVTLDDNVTTSGFCASCGHDLALTAAPPLWDQLGVDLRLAARWQRRLLWVILLSLIGQASLLAIGAVPAWVGPFIFGAMIAVQIVSIACVLSLMAALGIHVAWRVVVAVLMFAPCINLLVLLAVNQRASAALARGGFKVGLLGVPEERVVRTLATNRCHQCGYILTGIVSGVCPECGQTVEDWKS